MNIVYFLIVQFGIMLIFGSKMEKCCVLVLLVGSVEAGQDGVELLRNIWLGLSSISASFIIVCAVWIAFWNSLDKKEGTLCTHWTIAISYYHFKTLIMLHIRLNQ